MTTQPIHILQWGMTTGLGGIETFIMNVYRHIIWTGPKCSSISYRITMTDHCILRMRFNPWAATYTVSSCRSGTL